MLNKSIILAIKYITIIIIIIIRCYEGMLSYWEDWEDASILQHLEPWVHQEGDGT